MVSYTNKEAVEKHLGETITDDISSYIKASTEYINNYTQRDFQEGDEEIRFYDGNGRNELVIDPATEVTKVEYTLDWINWIEMNSDYWETNPYNKLPIRSIVLKFNNIFYNLKRSVRITGKFGWSDCVPADVKFCATVIACSMYKGKSSSEISSERIGDYQVSFENEKGIGDLESIKKMLDTYKKI